MDIFTLKAAIFLNTEEYERGLNNVKKTNAEYRSDVMQLANTYKSQGMNMSDAMKRAYSEIDKSQYDLSSHSETESKRFSSSWESAANKLNLSFSAIKAAGVAALGAVVNGVKDVVSQSFELYSQFEQLEGGIETLFKTSADTVKNYANEAYKNAGMSANEYMETVTGFAASLIQSTGRGEQQDTEQLKASLDEQYEATKQYLQDVYDAEKDSWDARIASARKYDEFAVTDLKHQKDEALKELKRANEAELDEMKAHNKQALEDAEAANNSSKTTAQSLQLSAELANQAVIDMSDNANKMGTSIQSIQYAYQGFAKQNYTMLDNLDISGGAAA